ncbi:MAG: HNH endonuclease signature motif containing protein [Acidimicrobiia bacterium]
MPGIVDLARLLREALVAFDPKRFTGEDCAALAEGLAATEKACAAARARAAARAAECGAHRQKGFADAADWLARTSGTSMTEAKATLATAKALEDMPDTRAAAAAGELSLAQAAELARTEAECPGSEAALLPLARNGSLRSLRDRALKARLGAIDPADLHRRQHRERSIRHWRNQMGMVAFAGALPPEVGLPFVNRLDAEADRLRRQAKGDGRAEAWEAHAADALIKLVNGSGRGKARSADLVIVCDLRAYRRGHPHPGEPVHLVGGGPAPVSQVRELGEDAFVKAVLHDGVDITTVAHYGRHLKAELRTALELGPLPDFDGVLCVEPDCDRRHHLEWDHVNPHANWGPTSYKNLVPRCGPHHQEKTARDRRAGLLRPREPGPDPP